MSDLYLQHLEYALQHAAAAVKDLSSVENIGRFKMESRENYLEKRLNTVQSLINLHKIMVTDNV